MVGEPFRLVPLRTGWLVVGVGPDAGRVLARHDLVGRRFRTRAATLRALSTVLAREREVTQRAGPEAALGRPDALRRAV